MRGREKASGDENSMNKGMKVDKHSHAQTIKYSSEDEAQASTREAACAELRARLQRSLNAQLEV